MRTEMSLKAKNPFAAAGSKGLGINAGDTNN